MEKTPAPTSAVATAPKEDQKKAGQVPSSTKEPQKSTEADIPFPSCRLIFVIMAFLGSFMVYCLRVNMSLAIVAMSKTSNVISTKTIDTGEERCPGDDTRKAPKRDGPFDITVEQQGFITSSFYWSYFILQIPSGTVAQMIGGKRIYVGAIFISSVCTLLTPVLAETGGYLALIAVRMIIGLAQGAYFPVLHVLVSKWATPQERSRMITSISAGSYIGNVLTNPMVGMLCDFVGWESVFYVTGVLGLLWSILGIFLMYDDPGVHPRISPAEYQHIVSSQGQKPRKTSFSDIPWRKILTSPPVYAVMTAHFVYSWGNFTFLSSLQQYLKYILNFDIKNSGFVSGIPYLVMLLLVIFSGVMSDYLMTNNIMSVTNIRKLMVSVGFIGCGSFIIATGYVKCNNPLAITLISLSIGFLGMSYGGWSANHADLAPPFAGTLVGISNTISTIAGITGTLVLGIFTKHGQTRAAWLKFFYLTGAIYLFGTIVYLLFGSGKRQEWGYLPPEDETAKTDKVTATPAKPATAMPATATPATATATATPATPVSAAAKPATPIPATATATPATAKPATATTVTPATATVKRTSASAKPATETAKPTAATAKPTTSTAKPTTATAKPTTATAKPTTATAKPTTATAKKTN